MKKQFVTPQQLQEDIYNRLVDVANEYSVQTTFPHSSFDDLAGELNPDNQRKFSFDLLSKFNHLSMTMHEIIFKGNELKTDNLMAWSFSSYLCGLMLKKLTI